MSSESIESQSSEQPETSSLETPAKNHQDADVKHTSWWQMFFLYPVFGVAFLSAVPTWIDAAGSAYNTLFPSGDAEASQLISFMGENPECVNSPFSWVEVADSTQIDGTICAQTGDVFLRIKASSGQVAYKGINISELVVGASLDENPKSRLFAAYAASDAAVDGFWNKQRPIQDIGVDKNELFAQQMAFVVCQKFVGGNSLVRHLRVGNQCFDEVVDTNTGIVKSTTQTACRNSC